MDECNATLCNATPYNAMQCKCNATSAMQLVQCKCNAVQCSNICRRKTMQPRPNAAQCNAMQMQDRCNAMQCLSNCNCSAVSCRCDAMQVRNGRQTSVQKQRNAIQTRCDALMQDDCSAVQCRSSADAVQCHAAAVLRKCSFTWLTLHRCQKVNSRYIHTRPGIKPGSQRSQATDATTAPGAYGHNVHARP